MTSGWAPARRGPTLLAATSAGVVGLLVLPLIYLLVRVLDGGTRSTALLRESATWSLVANTVGLALGVVTAALLVGGSLAWLVTRTDLPGRRLWAVAAGLPLVIPSYVAAFCFLAFFGEKGLLQEILGVSRLPALTGYPGALLCLTLATYPYVFLLTRAALVDLDPGLEEAARGLGVGGLRAWRRVTLPALRPALGLGALLAALYTLSDFGVVSLMRYDALTHAIYLQYRSLFDRTPAAVLALLLVALTVIALVLERRTRTRGRGHRVAPGNARRATPVPLGRWRWPALSWCALTTGLFLVLPLGVLAYWLGQGLSDGRGLDLPLAELWHSALAAGLAAVAATLVALPVAISAVRFRSRHTVVLERLAYAGNALPGLVIALALVFFAARYASFVYQTLALLVFAYVVRFFPQSLSGVESALQRVNPRVEEAARALGRGPFRTLTQVTVPLARSGVLAGAALVFLSALKELPATILLRPIGFDTLATEIWTLTQVGAYSRAAVPALVLIAASVPVLWLLSSSRGLERDPTTGVP